MVHTEAQRVRSWSPHALALFGRANALYLAARPIHQCIGSNSKVCLTHLPGISQRMMNKSSLYCTWDFLRAQVVAARRTVSVPTADSEEDGIMLEYLHNSRHPPPTTCFRHHQPRTWTPNLVNFGREQTGGIPCQLLGCHKLRW